MKISLICLIILLTNSTQASIIYLQQNRFVQLSCSNPQSISNNHLGEFNVQLGEEFNVFQNSNLNPTSFKIDSVGVGNIWNPYCEATSGLYILFELDEPMKYEITAQMHMPFGLSTFGHVLLYSNNLNRYLYKEYRGDRPGINTDPLDLYDQNILLPGKYSFDASITSVQYPSTLHAEFINIPEPTSILLMMCSFLLYPSWYGWHLGHLI